MTNKTRFILAGIILLILINALFFALGYFFYLHPILGDFDKAFHMGTKFSDGMFYTNGGRVLFVIGKGKTMKEAQADAYQNVSKISCENLFYRHDIGYQVIRSEDK